LERGLSVNGTLPCPMCHLRELVVDQTPRGGYTARALGEAIVTQADTVQGLHANVRDALRCHFDDGAAPRMIRLHFARDEVITARNGHATCPAPT
jgi:hypothetical protein